MANKATKNQKQRLDFFLVSKGIAETRSQAQQIIKQGYVKINGRLCTKSGFLVYENSVVEIDKNFTPYVSRGGIKLAYALKAFQINVSDKICLDVGAARGGFTDCLLKNGAKFVYAVDVGHGQLHPALKNNSRVAFFEGTDIRNFSLPAKTLVDLICIDVSFISLTLILPTIKRFLSPFGELVVLIKPQFEVDPKKLNKKGVVKEKKEVQQAVNKILSLAQKIGFLPLGVVKSPILGKEGNVEYLAYFKNANS